MPKFSFISDLQSEDGRLSFYDILTRLRVKTSYVPAARFDDGLDASKLRGYMLPLEEKHDRTPDDPELFWCVISTNQSAEWQNLTLVKEALHVLDGPLHKTISKNDLREVLVNRACITPHNDGDGHNVRADREGLILEVGSMLHKWYRTELRRNAGKLNWPNDFVASQVGIPPELVEWLLSDDFETEFEQALLSCRREDG